MTELQNLLKETINYLEVCEKSLKDVLWVQTRKGWATVDKFIKLANFEYDDGFGGTEISLKLKVVGDNWWLERHEYDGSEWWEFKELPTKGEQVTLTEELIKGDSYLED